MTGAIWLTLAVLIVGEAFLTWRSVLRFRWFFLNAAAETPGISMPALKAAVLAPCKGLDPGMQANIQSWLDQDYPDFAIFFIVESADDAACEFLRSMPGTSLLIAGKSSDSGQKIHNLRYAIENMPPEYEALAFVDSDARLRPDWLRSLMGCLQQHPGDAATGYRWFSPQGHGLGELLRSAWNAGVLTLYGPSGSNFAWGGSTAILRKTFDEVKVLQFWKGSLSDDYALTNALRASKRKVHFVPRAMALTRDRISAREFFSWAGRQLLITRLYFPHLWWMAFSFHVIWMLWVVLGVSFRPLWFLGTFLLVQTLQGLKSNIRLQCVKSIFPDAGSAVSFWMMSPLIGLSNFCMMISNLLTRTVTWRGIQYRILGRNRLERKGN